MLDSSYEDCVQNQLPTQAEEKQTSLEIWEPTSQVLQLFCLAGTTGPLFLCVYIVLWVCEGLVMAYLKNHSNLI